MSFVFRLYNNTFLNYKRQIKTETSLTSESDELNWWHTFLENPFIKYEKVLFFCKIEMTSFNTIYLEFL